MRGMAEHGRAVISVISLWRRRSDGRSPDGCPSYMQKLMRTTSVRERERAQLMYKAAIKNVC